MWEKELRVFTSYAPLKDDKITMTRTFKQIKGVYEASLYEDYQKLYKDIASEKNKLNVVILNRAS